MRVLVTWDAKHDETAGIGDVIARTLEQAGHEVIEASVREAPPPSGFDAVVVGGALYANRWHASARHWVEHHLRELQAIPTWMFSSGPLDEDPPPDVRSLMRRIGAVDHCTFAEPALAREWASEIASELPAMKPRPPEVLRGHTVMRLVEYGAYGWAICAVTFGVLLPLTRPTFAIVVHAIVAPVVFAMIARRYQAADGARAPLATAVVWTLMFGVLHAGLLSPVVRPELALVASWAAFWLPLALVFVAAWGAALLPVTRWDASRASPA
jgi:menaquinone-dependent protoporphyrinogen oxidase